MPNQITRRRVSLATTFAIALATQAVVVDAQVMLQLDASTGAVRLAQDQRGRNIDSVGDRTFRLRGRSPVLLRVINTNTATYRFSVSEEESPRPAFVGPILQFAPLLGPYLQELQYVVPRGRGKGANDQRTTILPAAAPRNLSSASGRLAAAALRDAADVETELHALDEVIQGPQGIVTVRTLARTTLNEMRDGNVEAAARRMSDSLHLPDQTCSESKGEGAQPTARINLAKPVLDHLDKLHPANATLATTLSDPAFTKDTTLANFAEPITQLHMRAGSALQHGDTLVAAGYQVENLATKVMSACSHWDVEVSDVSTTSGRTVTVNIEPIATPEIAEAAKPDKARTIKVSLLPPIDRIDARLGLTALYVPQAQFGTYGLRSTGGSAPSQIYESFVDNRFAYGLSLGLTWHPWFDWRGNSHVALWLPELTVATANGAPAFGFGGALSYRLLKFGMGAAVIRHDVLDTLGVGQSLPNDKFLKTHKTYAHPLTYFSVTIFGLADLLKGEADADKGDGAKSGGGKPDAAKGDASKPGAAKR